MGTSQVTTSGQAAAAFPSFTNCGWHVCGLAWCCAQNAERSAVFWQRIGPRAQEAAAAKVRELYTCAAAAAGRAHAMRPKTRVLYIIDVPVITPMTKLSHAPVEREKNASRRRTCNYFFTHMSKKVYIKEEIIDAPPTCWCDAELDEDWVWRWRNNLKHRLYHTRAYHVM